MKDNRVQVRRVLWITLLLNLFVMALKTIIGMVTGSLSLQADALHSVTDSANNVLGLVANRFSSPHPDREHPYGHQKFEALGALGISTFLGVVCFEIFKSAIARIFMESKVVTISTTELSLLFIVLLVNIFVATYESRVGKRINSPILIADAKHTMSDIWVTLLVIGGLVGVWQARVWNIPQLQWLDVILAFPVGEIAIAPEAIHSTVMEVPGVINCHDIASRGMIGRQVFVEMHLIVDAIDVETAHKITEEVEDHLEIKYSPIRVSIHIEPPDYQSDEISFGIKIIENSKKED